MTGAGGQRARQAGATGETAQGQAAVMRGTTKLGFGSMRVSSRHCCAKETAARLPAVAYQPSVNTYLIVVVLSAG